MKLFVINFYEIPNKYGTGESNNRNRDSGKLKINGCGQVKGLNKDQNVCLLLKII